MPPPNSLRVQFLPYPKFTIRPFLHGLFIHEFGFSIHMLEKCHMNDQRVHRFNNIETSTIIVVWY